MASLQAAHGAARAGLPSLVNLLTDSLNTGRSRALSNADSSACTCTFHGIPALIAYRACRGWVLLELVPVDSTLPRLSYATAVIVYFT